MSRSIREQMQAAAAVFDRAGWPDEAADCRARAAILDHYLAA